MKKVNSKTLGTEDIEMRPEYDFTGAVRGRAYRPLHLGYKIKIHKADGTTVVKDVKPRAGAIILEPDVQAYFPNSESVNTALRSLIKLIPTKPGRGKNLLTTNRVRKKISVSSGSGSKPARKMARS